MRYRYNNRLWVPADGPTPADAWYDVCAPDGIIMGAVTGGLTGIRLIRDWSGNGNHAVQTTANQQGAVAFLGPGGGYSITTDNVNDGWDYPNAGWVSGDHTFVIGCNTLHVPGPTNPQIQLFANANGAHTAYQVFGSAASWLSIFDAAGNHASDVALAVGVHAYSAVIDEAAHTAMLYRDTTSASAPVACAALADSSGYRQICNTWAYFAPDASISRAAIWNCKLPAAILARAQAWAVRDDG